MNIQNFSRAVVVCLFFAAAAFSQTNFQVDESKTEAFFQNDRLIINLAIKNPDVLFYGDARIEVLDANDKIIAQNSAKETRFTFSKGESFIRIPLDFTPEKSVSELLWYRLRYTLSNGKSGIVSFSEIFPELFNLRVSGSQNVFAGQNYVVRVSAFHPTKGKFIGGVKLNAELEIDISDDDDDDDEKNLKITANGETDADGFATLAFQIPNDVKFADDYWGAEIEITGEKNGLKSFAYENLRAEQNGFRVYLNADKPIYQPRQKISVRGLALSENGIVDRRKIVADAELEFLIKDEEDLVLYRETVKTSRFGIASIEWEIPDNAKIGTYQVEVKSDEKSRSDYINFKVSRYELPNFIVKTKTDKDFYLPNENTAEITIDALYLFGKPVEKGKVKIVRESERRWNYEKQKFDITEEEIYEGLTDADGKYTAKIDLRKTQEELAEKDDDYRFIDLDFTAYFTDSMSNKTEQRRFDIRVTKEPIHVYLVGLSGNDHNPKLPVEFFVTAFSAKGEPLVCDVEITAKPDSNDEYKTVAKVKTNKFGAANVEFRAPKDEDGDFDDFDLKVVARDFGKKSGTATREVEIDEDEKQIVVRTEKTVYKKGESINIEVLSSEPSETVFVDVSRFGSNLESKQVKLKNGRANLRIPYNEKFNNQLTISAYFDDGDGDAVKDALGIIFPEPQNLRVDINLEKDTYKPNEDAKFDLAVFSPDKKIGENALGIVILDKAVEERAITDNSFGGGRVSPNILSDYSSLLGFGAGFGGLTVNDLNELDLKKNLTKDIQLAAEVMFVDSYFDPNFFGGASNKNLAFTFRDKINEQFKPVEEALKKRYEQISEHPTDEASLKRSLAAKSIDFEELRDPWGNKYRAGFSINRESDVITIYSSGADKVFNQKDSQGFNDDFIVLNLSFNYFAPTGNFINKTVGEYHEKTGKYVRDFETLRRILLEKDFDLNALKDRWGEPYKIEFGASGKFYTISFRSGNSDKKFEDSYDNFTIWTVNTDYFAETEAKIEAVLNNFIKEKQTFPKDEQEFKAALKAGGIDFDKLRDGWDRPFYIETEIKQIFKDRIKVEMVAKAGEKAEEKLTVTPVTQQLGIFRVRSLGEKGEKETGYYQNPYIAQFAGAISEQAKDDGKPKVVVPKTVFTNGKSAIYGVVKDTSGAIIPSAIVTVTNLETEIQYTTETNAEGAYLQGELPAGRYSVKAYSEGFKTTVITEIVVAKESLTEMNFTLEIGSLNEAVTIVSGADVINSSDSSISTNVTVNQIGDLPINGRNPLSLLTLQAGVNQVNGQRSSQTEYVIDGQEIDKFRNDQSNNLPTTKKETPRLREYFPETLLWMPEIITNADGKAEVKFKLADNITTWKVYAIASGLDGRIGIANKEIKAFQPFFVDLNPPQILTKGDEIFLPVQVRNYTEKAQKVDVEMTKADWFSFLDADKKQIDVKQNSTSNAIFGFRADSIINEGLQRVTAYAETDSDAIEKPVEVKPDGKEVVATKSEIFTNSTAFDVNFPANVLPETQSAEVKIYPNLLAHVAESVEGLLQRPYGCGEQTISSTYPNLMILKFTKADNRLRPLANKFLQKGYERLLGYQVASGGFSYWGGNSEADVALTAYALRFLTRR